MRPELTSRSAYQKRMAMTPDYRATDAGEHALGVKAPDPWWDSRASRFPNGPAIAKPPAQTPPWCDGFAPLVHSSGCGL